MKRLSMATAALMALGALAAAPAQADQYVLDFETDASGNPLAPGTLIGEQWADFGVHITTDRPAQHPLMLFNSNCGPNFPGVDCTGDDDDLATGASFGSTPQGNVLILSEDGDSSDPDDFGGNGGDFIFTFDDLVTLDEVSIIDVDHVDYNDGTASGYLTAFGANDVVLENLDLRAGGDNGFEVYEFNDLTNVAKLIVHLPGSGAISGVEFTDLPAFEENDDPTPIPEPASTLGLLALGVCGTVSKLKRKRG